MDERERHRAPVRSGVLLLLLLLPAQFAVSFFIDELYPGITGPGFAGRSARDDVVRFIDCEAEVVCGDGDRRTVACEDLIEAHSHRSIFILRGLFPQSRPRCDEPLLADDAGLADALRFIRGRIYFGRERCEPPNRATRDWLRPYAARAADCSEPEALELEWQDVAIDLADGSTTRAQRARHSVSFGDGQAP